MSLNKNNKIEKTVFSLKYFSIVKNLNDNYINYIKTYLSISKEFYSKLLDLQKENEIKKKEILKKVDKNEDSNFSQIIKLINAIPKVFNLHLENLGNLLNHLEKEISLYTNFINEKETFVNKLKTQFNDSKNDYIKKEEEMNKLKTTFLNSMNDSEEIIYKFYSSQKEKKDSGKKNTEKKNNILNNIKLNINLDYLNINKNIITEEQVNNCINNTKKIENNYKEIIESGKMFQDTYIQADISSSENIKNAICDIFLQLKKIVMNSLMSLKNIFTIPDKEITNYLSELISDKEKKKNIEEAMDNYFSKNNIEKKEYIPIKYDLKVLKINNEPDENKKKKSEKKNYINLKFLNKLNFLGNKNESKISKGEKKISIFEDGLEEMPFINDEVALLTTKKMFNNFKLINGGGFKLESEEEKTETNKLSIKIISTFQKSKKKKNSENKEEDKKDEKNNEKKENNNKGNKDEFVIINDTEIISITKEEIQLFENLLDKHHNRIIFLQKLNEFRSTGRLIIPKKTFEMMGNFFNIILNKVKRDNDIHSYKNIILLSQTYYTLENDNKKYIQELLLDNEIFKDKQFWEELLDLELNREIKRLFSIEEKRFKNENIEGIKEMSPNKIGNLVFSQIVTICDNMISFGVNKETLYEIIEPNFKRYQLSQDFIDNIKEIVENRLEEEKKNLEENK